MQINHNRHVAVILDTNEPPYRLFGNMQAQDDESIVIRGTVGDYMNKDLVILKSKIKYVEVHE